MTQILALVGQKGGAGKSTLAVCLAVEAQARGERVLLCDADPQGTARVWAEAAAEAGHAAPTTIAMGASLHRPDQLPALAAGHDLVVIDCPGRLGDVQRAALMVATRVLVPCGPSGPEVWALGATVALLEEARRLRPELDARVVLTRVQPRTSVGAAARSAVESAGLPVLDAWCGYRVAYQEALLCGQGVTTYEPGGVAAREVRRLFNELLTTSRRKEPVRGRKEAAPRAPAHPASGGTAS